MSIAVLANPSRARSKRRGSKRTSITRERGIDMIRVNPRKKKRGRPKVAKKRVARKKITPRKKIVSKKITPRKKVTRKVRAKKVTPRKKSRYQTVRTIAIQRRKPKPLVRRVKGKRKVKRTTIRFNPFINYTGLALGVVGSTAVIMGAMYGTDYIKTKLGGETPIGGIGSLFRTHPVKVKIATVAILGLAVGIPLYKFTDKKDVGIGIISTSLAVSGVSIITALINRSRRTASRPELSAAGLRIVNESSLLQIQAKRNEASLLKVQRNKQNESSLLKVIPRANEASGIGTQNDGFGGFATYGGRE